MSDIKIPYGEADFKKVREEKFVYIDKTMYIEKLENYSKAIYVRPRRFGKSLFTSMMSYYYDISEKENFERLYKGLYIYDNPTEKKNSYYILKFNFSGMDVNSNKSVEDIEEKFDENVYSSCQYFIDKYKLDIKIERGKSASIILMELLRKFSTLRKSNKIYIVIDEYDHFTNGMIEGDVSRFVNSLGQGGFVRAFYEVIKMYAEGTDSVVDRFFATGIAPLTLDSLTSGFNIAVDISLKEQFVSMCGFTEDEVKKLLKKVRLSEKVYNELKKNYNGYRFSPESEVLTFNVTLLLYYLRECILDGRPPRTPVDSNLATTGNKIRSIVNLVNKEKNYAKLLELITTGVTSGRLVEKFELDNLTFDENSFLSLLFYNGYITIKEVGARIKFCVPNYVSQVLYANYFTKLINVKEIYKLETSQIENSIEEFGETGKIEQVTKVVSNFLTYQSVRDKEGFNEKMLKYVYTLFFGLSSEYYVYGEYPSKQGFLDIFVEKSEMSYATYEAVVELKYLNKENAKTANKEKLKEEAIKQMKKYMEDNRLNEKENLKKYAIIFTGFEKYDIYEVEE